MPVLKDYITTRCSLPSCPGDALHPHLEGCVIQVEKGSCMEPTDAEFDEMWERHKRETYPPARN